MLFAMWVLLIRDRISESESTQQERVLSETRGPIIDKMRFEMRMGPFSYLYPSRIASRCSAVYFRITLYICYWSNMRFSRHSMQLIQDRFTLQWRSLHWPLHPTWYPAFQSDKYIWYQRTIVTIVIRRRLVIGCNDKTMIKQCWCIIARMQNPYVNDSMILPLLREWEMIMTE